jgi:cytochrome c biogenesis protein ResB
VRARWRAAAGHAMAVVAARARWRRVREWVKEQGALRRAREKAGTATRNVGEVRGTGRGVMGGYSETRQYARRAEKALGMSAETLESERTHTVCALDSVPLLEELS